MDNRNLDTQIAGSTIYHEIAPLKEEDCLYVIDRKKACFDFPLHTHNVYELNFIEGAEGAVRVVGDSICEIADSELVLVANTELIHGWLDGNLKSRDNIHEITIQFRPDILPKSLLNKNQFKSVMELLGKGMNGVSFSFATILKVRSLLHSLVSETKNFYMVTTFLNLLYELSIDKEMQVLSTKLSAQSLGNDYSRRIKRVCDYVDQNYARLFKLKDVAHAACMSEAAISRFFKEHTGKSLSTYIIDVRLAKACRLLIDSNSTIAEICYATGFNNISNFNRQFKRSKGVSPKKFREFYRKKHVLV